MKKMTFPVMMFAAFSANAYDSNDDTDLFKERSSQDYRQLGVRAHSFNFLPSFDYTEEYNTNVFFRDASTGNIKTDFVSHYKPGMKIESDWNRHALNFKFDSDITQYHSLGNQANYQDLFSKVDGRLDFTRNSFLSGGFGYNSVHENRGSVDQTQGIGPTFYDSKVFEGFYHQVFNRVSLKTGLDAVRYDYQDVQTSLGTTLEMSSRNHWEYMPSARFGYQIQPEYEAFVKIIPKLVQYDGLVYSNGNTSTTAFNRNSTGYNVLGGMAFDLTDLVTGDMSVGYLERNYEDARLASISGINGFLNLKWRPTRLTTVTSRISHDINETTQSYVSGVKATNLAMGVEHELTRQILFKLGGTYGYLSYQGYAPNASYVQNLQDRQDNLYGGSASAKYLLNRYLSSDVTYTFQNRDTNYLNSGYTVNQVMLNLRGQF